MGSARTREYPYKRDMFIHEFNFSHSYNFADRSNICSINIVLYIIKVNKKLIKSTYIEYMVYPCLPKKINKEWFILSQLLIFLNISLLFTRERYSEKEKVYIEW